MNRLIDFATTYELTGRTEQVFLSKDSKGLGISGFAVARGEQTLPRGTTFISDGGKVTADIIGTGFASLYLISSRLVGRLVAEGVTGWRSEPVNFTTAPSEGYHTLAILGRCGPIRYDLSEVVEKKRSGKVTRWWRGAYFDQSTWDGNEMFTPIDTGSVFIVSRVREILRSFDLDGVKAVPLASVERLILPILLSN